MTNRTPRKQILAVAAIAATGLLGLTACASDSKNAASTVTGTTGTASGNAPAVGAPTSGDPSQNQSPATTAPTASTAPPKSSAKPSAPKSTAPPASNRPTDCATTQLKSTVTNLTRPINHVLLTVTNIGKSPCNLYYYPDLRFDADQQAVTQPVEDSKPQAVVTIAPGESGYAAIGTSAADGSGGSGTVEKQVEVMLESRDQSGSLPGELVLQLPPKTYVDDKAFVTYWQSDLQSAIAW